MKLFLGGQKCKRCNDVFEEAKWDVEYIERALEKLLRKVKQKCYGLPDSASSTAGNQRIQANMTAPHQTHLCQLSQLRNCPYNRQHDVESNMLLSNKSELLNVIQLFYINRLKHCIPAWRIRCMQTVFIYKEYYE